METEKEQPAQNLGGGIEKGIEELDHKDVTGKVAANSNAMTRDEYHLASLGYKQSFVRSLGILESWAATFTTMNFVSGLPILFGWVMVCTLSTNRSLAHD